MWAVSNVVRNKTSSRKSVSREFYNVFIDIVLLDKVRDVVLEARLFFCPKILVWFCDVMRLFFVWLPCFCELPSYLFMIWVIYCRIDSRTRIQYVNRMYKAKIMSVYSKETRISPGGK